MQIPLPTSHIAIGIEHIANETTDGIHSDPIYGQANKNSSLSVPTSGHAFDASYGVPTHPSNAGGSVDTATGSDEALLNRSSVLFVAMSFIVLMALSLSWLVFYYVQRFRYLHSKERVSRRLAELARKAVARIPVKTLHSGDKETNSDLSQCAICIEPFLPLDNIRILPCRHYFHKLCIDPWLLEQRSCPMCKLDILQVYGLRTEYSSYPPTHSDLGPGAGPIGETARGSASNTLPGSPEEHCLEHVSLLVHHTGDEPASATVTSSGAEPVGLRQTALPVADWWSVELAEAGQPVTSRWPGMEQGEATVSLQDQHLAPTGLLLAAPPLTSGNNNNNRQQQYCHRSPPASACVSTSVTFVDGTVVSAVRPKLQENVEARHSVDDLLQTCQCLPDFYDIDGQKTEEVTVTTACSLSPATATGSNKRQASRPDRKCRQYSLANRLSSLLSQRFQSPWSSSGGSHHKSPAGGPNQKLQGSDRTLIPTQTYSRALLPSTLASSSVSFRSLRMGEIPVAASANAMTHRPVGSERIVVAVVEPAPPYNTTASGGSPEQVDVADQLLSPQSSCSSLAAVDETQNGGTGEASGRASSDAAPSDDQH